MKRNPAWFKVTMFAVFWLPTLRAAGQCGTFNIQASGYTAVTCAGAATGRITLAPITGGTGPYTYSWSPSGGTSAAPSALSAGSYTVTATDANGCQGVKTFIVPEALAAGPTVNSPTVCKGSTATLLADGTPPGSSYKWYSSVSATPIAGQTADTYTTPGVKTTTTWYVSSVNASGCESARSPAVVTTINPLYPLVNLDSSLIMHYKFDNNTADSAGRHANATRVLTTNFTQDRNAKSQSALNISYNTSTNSEFGYVDLGSSADLNALTDKLTISLWISRGVASGTTAPVVNKWQANAGFYLGTYLDGGGRKVIWKLSGTAQVISSQNIPDASVERWHHVVGVYTGSELRIYQNGVLTGSAPHTGNIAATTASNMMIARQSDGTSPATYTGGVDELRVYNRALNDEEIKTLFNNESVAFENTPVCEGAVINLSTLPVTRAAFQWTGPSGFTASVQDPAPISPAASAHAGNYTLRVTRNGCTTPPQTAVVQVNALPLATITPSATPSFCDGNTITLTAPAASAWHWSTGATTRTINVTQGGDYTVTVTDNKSCSKTSDPFTVTVNPVNDAPAFTRGADVVAYENIPVNLAAWATQITAGPGETTQSVSFTATNSSPALFAVQPSVSAAGDLTFIPADNVTGTATVTLSLHDDGGNTCGTDQSADQTFTITVNDVNDAPVFTKGIDAMLDEDAGAWTKAGWATGIAQGGTDTGQNLTFVATTNNPGLFSVQPVVSAAGDLAFTAAADAHGVATVTLYLQDDGGTARGGIDRSAAQTFTITVIDVNDAPGFTPGGDIVLAEDAPPQTYPAWATGISAGPGEASQTLHFAVAHDNPALFSAPPAISAAGDLTFTPAAGAEGIATVSVTLWDDGGTANGGTDHSSTRTFTITLQSVNDAPSFTPGPDVRVAEDAARYSAPWATNARAGDEGQTLTFRVAAANPGLFRIPPAISTAGILSFEVMPDAYGTTQVEVYVMDNGGTALGGVDQSGTETFTIAVDAVNDAPRIDAVGDRFVAVNSRAIVIELTGIDAGTGEEGQHLTLAASSGNAALLPDPQISALQNGRASVTLAPLPDVTGMATLTILLKDDGGTANGGVDETVMTFNLTVEGAVQAFFLPNLFSPNGNGANDVFRVRAAGIDEIDFRIYDVYGREVFRTADVTTATEAGWNGQYQGKDQPAGTYTWTLRGTYTDGRPLTDRKTRNGQVILIR